MSNNIFMALALSAMFMTSNAQDQQDFQNQQRQKPTITPEQRAERSAARIAGQLMLNDADAEKFKGVYKNYQLELSEANQKFKKEPKKMEQGEKTQRRQRTEQEIEQDIKNRFARQRAVLDVEEKTYIVMVPETDQDSIEIFGLEDVDDDPETEEIIMIDDDEEYMKVVNALRDMGFSIEMDE